MVAFLLYICITFHVITPTGSQLWSVKSEHEITFRHSFCGCDFQSLHVGSRVVRIDPLNFLAGCLKRQLNQALSFCLNIVFSLCCCLIGLFCIVSLNWYGFYVLVVLLKLSVHAKWLARKTPLRKPNHGEGIISTKPRPESLYDFLGLMYCFMMCLCCPPALCDIFNTPMARYSVFVLKVPLNTNQLTNCDFWSTGSKVGSHGQTEGEHGFCCVSSCPL